MERLAYYGLPALHITDICFAYYGHMLCILWTCRLHIMDMGTGAHFCVFRFDAGYAIPAVNCVSSSGINACLEAARKCDAPIIIQFSSGGSQVNVIHL
jgi:hypothetical protein